jgi:hypothetical protein
MLAINPLFTCDRDLKRCPKFDTCNASLCPLGYAAGRGGVHPDGEEICPIALEFKKKGGLERLRMGAEQLQRGRQPEEPNVRRRYPLEVLNEIERVLPAIREEYPEICRKTTRRMVSEATLARLAAMRAAMTPEQQQEALRKAREARLRAKLSAPAG